MENNLVSVITPTWNRPLEILERCIRSVEYQTHTNWEHIICSDGPNPVLEKYLQERNSSKLRYIHLSEHSNDFGNTPRQFSLQYTNGNFIVFLDDDNLIYPHFFEKMLAPLSDTKIETGFAVCKILHLGPLPKHLGNPPKVLSGIPVRVKNIDSLQVMVKKRALFKIGGWDQKSGYFADGYTFQRLAEKFSYVTVDQILGIHA